MSLTAQHPITGWFKIIEKENDCNEPPALNLRYYLHTRLDNVMKL